MRKPQKNFLDMVPVRNVAEFTREGEKITLLIPKFKNRWMQLWLIPPRRSKNISVHLDETGSRVWDLIDGTRDTGKICELLNESLTDQTPKKEPIEIRITDFLRQLYKHRLILFK